MKNWLIFLFVALFLGALLRLSYPGDIEYKADEEYMFRTAQTAGVTEPWPVAGLQRAEGGRPPAMGTWVFVVLSRLAHASTPPELARAVQWFNILGLLTLAFFSLRIIPEPEKPFWCWATAFAAVNPFAVLFHRKIWIPCILPPFCVLLWIAWHYRPKWWGAFFWGLVGACLGQVHMSGFFLAAGVFLLTIIYERRIRWGPWVLGSLIGAIPIVPWLQYLATQHETGFHKFNFLWVLYPKYWVYWFSDATGLGLAYDIKTIHFLDYLRYPLIDGTGTYLVAISHIAIIVTVILILAAAKKRWNFQQWIQDRSETGMALKSVLGLAGVMMTLTSIEVCRHYVIMSFPLEWVWLSRLGLVDPHRGRRYLTILWVAQLILSAAFFWYLHVNHGDPIGEYGTAYQFQ